MYALEIPILRRVRNNRRFYLPPQYSGFGRPRACGRKIRLDDARTPPPIDAQDECKLEGGGRIEVSRWDDVRMKLWPTQRLISNFPQGRTATNRRDVATAECGALPPLPVATPDPCSYLSVAPGKTRS
jgi:hypothetical protein